MLNPDSSVAGHVVAAVLVIINLAAFIAMGLDKRQARRHGWRIPEATLLLWALAGGSIGAITGMLWFRHKTRHSLFRLGLPVILTIQLTLAAWLLSR